MLSAPLLLHCFLIQQSIHSTNEMKFNKSGRHKEEVQLYLPDNRLGEMVLEFINLISEASIL
ncbi:Uncharacterized protein BM_BM14240 [Brugia malayi]|uniref:Bm14240 n=1 Tax=Brugia malayi TaxID=6279 RepID=A0A0K0J0M4_BRUMA|nr:Uncharacterized protein BM_BM14240 [Brugia malayi]CDP98073.1 Bm14240 [Brugia malayi]VIO93841.1 Uncharacterized protein BM_BM14240 [Brugia malayi]